MVPRIELKVKGIHTEVIIDGKPLEKVRSVCFIHKSGELPVLSVDFAAADLYMDGEFVPSLPEVFRPYYKHKETPASESEGPEG